MLFADIHKKHRPRAGSYKQPRLQCRWDERAAHIRPGIDHSPGRSAEVIAVPGNPLDHINVMQHVTFVMKDGVIFKQDGKPTI